MLPEVDWGAHNSSFFIYLENISHDGDPKSFFTQGLRVGLPQRTSSTPLMEYLKDSFDTGQIEDGFFNSKSIKGYISSYSLPDPEHNESSYNLLTQWDPGERPLQPPLFWKGSTSELTAKTKGSVELLTGFYPKLKSFLSCSHMNCCQHYKLHINLHIIYIHFIKLNLNLKEFQESINYFKSSQVNKT